MNANSQSSNFSTLHPCFDASQQPEISQERRAEYLADYKAAYSRLADALDVMQGLAELLTCYAGTETLSSSGRDGVAKTLKMIADSGWNALDKLPLPDAFTTLLAQKGNKEAERAAALEKELARLQARQRWLLSQLSCQEDLIREDGHICPPGFQDCCPDDSMNCRRCWHDSMAAAGEEE